MFWFLLFTYYADPEACFDYIMQGHNETYLWGNPRDPEWDTTHVGIRYFLGGYFEVTINGTHFQLNRNGEFMVHVSQTDKLQEMERELKHVLANAWTDSERLGLEYHLNIIAKELDYRAWTE